MSKEVLLIFFLSSLCSIFREKSSHYHKPSPIYPWQLFLCIHPTGSLSSFCLVCSVCTKASFFWYRRTICTESTSTKNIPMQRKEILPALFLFFFFFLGLLLIYRPFFLFVLSATGLWLCSVFRRGSLQRQCIDPFS